MNFTALSDNSSVKYLFFGEFNILKIGTSNIKWSSALNPEISQSEVRVYTND